MMAKFVIFIWYIIFLIGILKVILLSTTPMILRFVPDLRTFFVGRPHSQAPENEEAAKALVT